jgi:hypothetical protein
MASDPTVLLPAELYRELEEFAATDGTTPERIVATAVRAYLFSRRFRALRAQLMPLAEAIGIFTDEDVFRHVS